MAENVYSNIAHCKTQSYKSFVTVRFSIFDHIHHILAFKISDLVLVNITKCNAQMKHNEHLTEVKL